MAIYSHSRLDTFETCPKQYWYKYVEKPNIERVDSVEAFLGSRAHDTLEEVYRRRMDGQVLSKDEVLALYEQYWDAEWHDGIHIVSQTYSAEDYREVGRECIRGYYDRFAPFDQDRTLRLEARVQIALDDAGQYKLLGYIDRLSQRYDGVYEVHDYKTSRSIPTQEQADADRQLALYQIGVESMWDDVEQVELIWHYLRFDKDICSRRTPEQLAEVRQQCIEVIQDIESRGTEESHFPAQESQLCDWCDFRSLCPATKHFVAVQSLPPEEFTVDSGVKLVDQLFELAQKKSQLKAQIRSIEEEEADTKARITTFAEEMGLISISGSSHQVKIRYDEQIGYPKSDSTQRGEFEEALRQAGVWEDVIAPTHSKLTALWKNRSSLSNSTRKILEDYYETDKTAKVSLSELKEN
jgi:putative RecB family exonuclease